MNKSYIMSVATTAVDNVANTYDYVFSWSPTTWDNWARCLLFMKGDQGGSAVSSMVVQCTDQDNLQELEDLVVLTEAQQEVMRDDKPVVMTPGVLEEHPNAVSPCQYPYHLRIDRCQDGTLTTVLVVGEDEESQVEAILDIEPLKKEG